VVHCDVRPSSTATTQTIEPATQESVSKEYTNNYLPHSSAIENIPTEQRVKDVRLVLSGLSFLSETNYAAVKVVRFSNQKLGLVLGKVFLTYSLI